MNGTSEVSIGVFLGWMLLALVGAGVAVAQARALKREPALRRERLAPWRASASQFCAFTGVAVFCLLAVGLICSAAARAIFPELLSSGSGILYLIPVMQTLSLVALLLSVKIFPEAFPKNFDADSAELREPARVWLSPNNRFGVPAMFATGFCATLVLMLLTQLLIPYLPESFQNDQVLVTALRQADNPLLVAVCVPAIAILTPIIEEIIFRAGLYRFLKSKMSAVPAAVLSSVIFALMHDAPASYLPLTVLGCVFCWSYEKTGRLAAPICVHALFNANTLLGVAAS